ncbi:F-box domain protein [Zymoseptoria brevis]|uniref:F-box domain protein n=1 Tax=Zymoseptoria brevis TaxID=1047168 RepID=A0A0F4GDV4_9PEZI|nr:F-box domain protein [Zymoseptoria brevis]
MTSPCSIISLPAELLEEIVQSLELNDVCNLRLTASGIASQIARGSFRAHFKSKSVKVSCEDFRCFAIVTQPNWLGCTLEHLTIVGSPQEDNEACESDDSEISDLLLKALHQLRANSKTGALRSINLTVEGTTVMREHFCYTCDWSRIWKCADKTARLLAEAMLGSAISVQSLDLYSATPRCALNSSQLQTLLNTFDMPELRSLSFAVSNNEDGTVDDEGAGLSKCLERFLIPHARGMEELNMRWLNLHLTDVPCAKIERRRFFDGFAGLSLPSLNTLSLKGMEITSEALVSFLSTNPQIRRINLEWLHILAGKFDAVCTQMTKCLELDSIYLNDLWERRLLEFPGAGGPAHFPGYGFPTWTLRTGMGTREKIQYRDVTGHMKGSFAANIWRRERGQLYGPPGSRA